MKDALIAAAVLFVVTSVLFAPAKALGRYVRRVDDEARRVEVSLSNVQGKPDGTIAVPAPWMGALVANYGTFPIANVRCTVISPTGVVKHQFSSDSVGATGLLTAKWPKAPGDDPDRYERNPKRWFNAVLRVEFSDRNGSRWVVDSDGGYTRSMARPWIWLFLAPGKARAKLRSRRFDTA